MTPDDPTPSVSDALGNAGPLPEIAWKGKTYKVGHPCPDAIAFAEEAVLQLAWDQVKKAKGGPADLYAELKAETLADIQSRKNAYGCKLFTAALDGPDGDPLILYACLKLNHPDLTVAAVRKMMRDDEPAEDVELALARVSPGFFMAGAGTRVRPKRDREAEGVQTAARVVVALAQREQARTAWGTCPPTSAPTPG